MKTIKKFPLILTILSFLTIFTPVNAEIKVVATIKPVSYTHLTLPTSPKV